MKPRIFIGSSAEELSTLNQIIDLIADKADCIPWTNAFSSNKSGLDSLLKQTRVSDFSILIATKDDITIKRSSSNAVPRDNVIFEFGLFLGSTGVNRSFLIAEEDVDLPSDLDGITVFKFTLQPDKYNSLDKIVSNILIEVDALENASELGLLPSTALAIGYYNSFLRKVCEEIHRTSCIFTEGKEIKVSKFTLLVVIPESLDDSGVDDFITLYNKKNSLTKATTNCQAKGATASRGYPFHFRIEPADQDENKELEVHLCDIPTTLNTISESIKLYLPLLEVGSNKDFEYLEKRELNNFTKVLKYLVAKNAVTRNNVVIQDGIQV